MKKSITVLLVLAVAIGGVAVILSCGSAPKAPSVIAAPESDFEVTTANEKVTITSYKGSAKDVVIPAKIGGLPVVEIRRNAFNSRKEIISVQPALGTLPLSAASALAR